VTQSLVHPWNEALWRVLPERDQLPPVMLLSGPAGVGKAAFAMALAHGLLCSQLDADRRACGRCSACRLALAGNHPDLRVLGGGEEQEDEDSSGGDGGTAKTKASRWIKVGSVRQLADFLAFSAHLGGRKVVVVEQADRLHPSAANAMLKTLEEPPSLTHFLLVSGRAARLPATVRSRCVTLTFALPGIELGISWLSAQGAARPELALAQAGSAPLTALALDVPEYWSVRDAFVEAVLAREDFDPVAVVDRLGQDSLPIIVQALQRWCYDLASLAASGVIRYNPDCAQILHRLAARGSLLPMLRFQRQLNEVVRSIEHPLNARLVAQRCLFGYKAAVSGTEA
jgi:DNA polymerase-3 subunit delta'